MIQNKVYGLIGKHLPHSFSPKYFNNKFDLQGLSHCNYKIFEYQDIAEVKSLKEDEAIAGINVTIPYKKLILPYLDEITDTAYEIGAVNTIKIEEGKWIGYNTDYLGFDDMLVSAIAENPSISRAVILGSGGASQAIQYALEQRKISFLILSRRGVYTYDTISDEVILGSDLIINTTPLGMYPDLDHCAPLNYDLISSRHSCIDLIYNPKKTLFLRKSEQQGAKIYNGLEMLISQAEHSWNIWTNYTTEQESNGRPVSDISTQF